MQARYRRGLWRRHGQSDAPITRRYAGGVGHRCEARAAPRKQAARRHLMARVRMCCAGGAWDRFDAVFPGKITLRSAAWLRLNELAGVRGALARPAPRKRLGWALTASAHGDTPTTAVLLEAGRAALNGHASPGDVAPSRSDAHLTGGAVGVPRAWRFARVGLRAHIGSVRRVGCVARVGSAVTRGAGGHYAARQRPCRQRNENCPRALVVLLH